MEMNFNDFEIPNDVIETGNGDCGYIMFPNLCGCNPGPNGGYECCNKENCPLKNND